MLLFVPVIAVLSLAFFLADRLGARIENCILAVLSAIVVVLFAASFFNLLAAATYAMAAAGWAVLPFVLVSLWREPRSASALAYLITPALLIVVKE